MPLLQQPGTPGTMEISVPIPQPAMMKPRQPAQPVAAPAQQPAPAAQQPPRITPWTDAPAAMFLPHSAEKKEGGEDGEAEPERMSRTISLHYKRERWYLNNQDAHALRRAIHENPDDDAPKLIYSDWLRDNGEDKLADLIQLHVKEGQTSEPGSRAGKVLPSQHVAYNIVTRPRGSWRWQDAFAVHKYIPKRNKQGRWIYKLVDRPIPKASLPQLRRSRFFGSNGQPTSDIVRGASHNTEVAEDIANDLDLGRHLYGEEEDTKVLMSRTHPIRYAFSPDLLSALHTKFRQPLLARGVASSANPPASRPNKTTSIIGKPDFPYKLGIHRHGPEGYSVTLHSHPGGELLGHFGTDMENAHRIFNDFLSHADTKTMREQKWATGPVVESERKSEEPNPDLTLTNVDRREESPASEGEDLGSTRKMRMARWRAPAGGVVVRGLFYQGGKLAPAEASGKPVAPKKRRLTQFLRELRSSMKLARNKKSIEPT